MNRKISSELWKLHVPTSFTLLFDFYTSFPFLSLIQEIISSCFLCLPYGFLFFFCRMLQCLFSNLFSVCVVLLVIRSLAGSSRNAEGSGPPSWWILMTSECSPWLCLAVQQSPRGAAIARSAPAHPAHPLQQRPLQPRLPLTPPARWHQPETR